MVGGGEFGRKENRTREGRCRNKGNENRRKGRNVGVCSYKEFSRAHRRVTQGNITHRGKLNFSTGTINHSTVSRQKVVAEDDVVGAVVKHHHLDEIRNVFDANSYRARCHRGDAL